MSLTNEQLAAARDREDWVTLWPEAQTRANFSIDQLAGNGTSDPEEPNYDPDVCQVAYEAAWKTLPKWDASKGVLDTHIKAQVQGAIHDYWRTEQTGGIGSAWVSREGAPAEHISMANEIGHDEEGGDMPTMLDELTYADSAEVPQGYGSIEQELARDSLSDTIAYYMHGLSEDDVRLVRAVLLGDQPVTEYAEEIGVHHSTVQYRVAKVLKLLRNKQKSSYVLGIGIANWKGLQSHFPVRRRFPAFWSDAEGMFTANPIWSEATGRVWNSWEWKPQLGDIPDLTILRKHERAAQKRAA